MCGLWPAPGRQSRSAWKPGAFVPGLPEVGCPLAKKDVSGRIPLPQRESASDVLASEFVDIDDNRSFDANITNARLQVHGTRVFIPYYASR